MKHLILLLTTCLLLSCSPENNVPLPGQDMIEQVLRNNILEIEKSMAKHHADLPQDSIGNDIYLKAAKLSEASLKNVALIDEIHYDLSATNTRKRCTEIFDEMHQQVLDITGEANRKEYPLLQTASGNKYENKILLLSYIHEVLSVLRSKLIPNCTISTPYSLRTIADQKTIKKGASFKCLNILEKTHPGKDLIYPVKIERIVHNGKPVSIQPIKTLFENRYTEYTPEHTGKYTIYFSQKIYLTSGRIETYPSEISFEVIP